MKKILVGLFVVLTINLLQASVTTIKLMGGWNSWVFGSAIADEKKKQIDNPNLKIRGGGLQGEIHLLWGPTNLIQFGAEFGYLPLFSASYMDLSSSFVLLPLTANIVFNSPIGLYGDFGLGFGWVQYYGSQESEVRESLETVFSKPAFLGKFAFGINKNITQLIGLDASIYTILPFTSFGNTGIDNFFLNMIAFWQIGIRVGISFSF